MFEHIDGCVRPEDSGLGKDHPKEINAETGNFFVEQRTGIERRKIGIIGLGSVGSALKAVLSYFYEVHGYDIRGNHDWSKILSCEAVFICVQTPEGKDGRLDCSRVNDVLKRLQESNFSGVTVIKSTLRVGFMDEARKNYPGLRLVYSPEFMSEKNAFIWTANPDRIVLTGNENDMDYVQILYYWADGAKIIRTDDRSAEIGKLAHNSYIALKVTFTNMMERISIMGKASPDDVMKIVYTDRRVGNSAHLEPHKGPYGGKCVPKDTAELINAFGEVAKLLKVADEFNDAIINLEGIVTQENHQDPRKYLK